ncbi:hypothetical protein N9933_02450 [bacterium]|nr:hypothetical protein [bacterium]
MQTNIKDKLRYRFEKYLNRGGFSIFVSLFVVFVILFVLMITIRWTMLNIWPELAYRNSFFDDIWLTWLQMTDPGNMNQDNFAPTWLKITTILSGVFGVVILSTLIAFITTSLEKVFYDFRKGRGKIIEENHTLILGWNERVVDIIRELILANESEKYASIVILSGEDKEEMDDLITKRIPHNKTTNIITSTGDYANINELKRVNAALAKSVILLANCSDSAFEEEKVDSDIQSIKAIMAIISCQAGANKLPIIAEIFTPEKRELVSYFEDENIIALDSWEIMGKLLVQTSLTSGLDMVYNEILSFDGGEIYFYKSAWNQADFRQLPFHMRDGIPLGVYNEKDGMRLRPERGYKMKEEDQVIMLAEDDSSIRFETEPIYTPTAIKLVNTTLTKEKKSILLLGWHNMAEMFISQSADYLQEGSTFDVYVKEPQEAFQNRIEELTTIYPKFNITLTDMDSLVMENLSAIRPFEYDNIVILSQDVNEQRVDRIDSDTLIILLLLRKIKSTLPEVNTKIITQVLNSDNQEIITQTDVDDFIISNKLITMILAQLSESPLIMKFYEDIFSEDGSEIYVKSIGLYIDQFPLKARFCDLIGLADQRDEICLGIRKGSSHKDANENFGVLLNPDKNQLIELERDDFLVVLAENEL